MKMIVGIKFQLKLTILIFFGPNLLKKGISGRKRKNHPCASMVVTYYIKLFCTEAYRYNGILMSLLLLVAETKIKVNNFIIVVILFFVFHFRPFLMCFLCLLLCEELLLLFWCRISF